MAVLWQGKWVILFTTFLCLALALFYSFHLVTPRYGATATLRIASAPDNLQAMDADRGRAGQTPLPGTDPAHLNTEIAMITSDAILARVIADERLLEDPEFNRYLTTPSPWAPRSLRTRLRHALSGTTEPVPDSRAVAEKTIANLRGAITAHRPADTYLLRITAQSRDADKAATLANAAARAYLAAQQDARDADAVRAEGWLAARLAELDAQLRRQEGAIAAQIADVQLQADGGIETLSTRLLAIEEERAAALTRLAVLDATNPTTRQLAEQAQARDTLAEVTARRDLLQAQLAAQSAGQMGLHQMQREADATRVLYETLLARREETRIARGLDTGDSVFLTPAVTGQYAGPQKVQILAMALVAGLLAGIGLVWLRHGLRNGFADAAALRDVTGQPILAQMPHAAARHLRLTRADSPLRLAGRSLRAGLMLQDRAAAHGVVAITGCTQGASPHALALGLAAELAASQRRVLVIATDHGDRQVRRLCRKVPRAGLVDVLAESATLSDAICRTACGADLAFAAKGQGDGGLVMATGFASLLTDLRCRYDDIVIATPPLPSTAEAALYGKVADALILVVARKDTPRDAVLQALSALERAGAPVAGLVLTGAVPVRATSRHWLLPGRRIAGPALY